MNRILISIFTILYVSVSYGDHWVLDVPYDPQENSNLCWAACCVMVLDAYDASNNYCSINSYNQSFIVHLTRYMDPNVLIPNLKCPPNIPPASNYNFTNELTGFQNSVDNIVGSQGGINTNYDNGNISYPHIRDEIGQDNKRPIFAGIADHRNASKHMVVIVGYNNDGTNSDVVYHDPDDNSFKEKSYAMFNQTGSKSSGPWDWIETLRCVTPNKANIDWKVPSDPVVCKIFDATLILGTLEEEDEEFIDQAASTIEVDHIGQSLSFRGHNYHTHNGPSDPPDFWEWKIVFPHTDGYAVIASHTSTESDYVSQPYPCPAWENVWELSSFSLPEGYDWKHNYEGKIAGRVELKVEGVAEEYDFCAVDIVYNPDEQYPDYVMFQNKIVNQHNLEIKSHYTTEVRNVSFPSNYWNNKVMSGENLILDGSVGDVTVEANTGVEFIVDPALK